MKALVSTLLVACALAVPAAAFAQTADTAGNAPVTRAQVKAELTRLEQAGYRPLARDNNYPDDIQRAEAIVAQQDAQKAQQSAPANNAVGGVAMTGSSDSGAPVLASTGGRSIYAGH
ncbi:DUF4148 domain-containing protein [Paraburkholderia sp. JHI2823]|uniref:DUF4148 domain-containing protein n=1 Tax=Paraburkholderia sp. JHI2823 TaxID=3112960 RepID=UPI003175ACFF